LIAGFDHIVIAVRDLERGVLNYETLLGRAAAHRSERDGVASALIVLDNISVELMAPAGESEAARRLNAAIEDGGEGLKSLVFAAADIKRAHRRAGRVALEPEDIVAREAGEAAWRSFRVDTERTHGVRLFVLERDAPLAPAAKHSGGVDGIDHIVIRTSDPQRAAALYGARLGLDMRLDRELAGRRMMFFRCGDAIVEIIGESASGAERDTLWGLSWRVTDAEGSRTRLAAAGLDVSELREGMKPGTRVFTVRSGACGVPTLMIEPAPRRD
jgi:catechol 2,3-dioxygenase-like lactoylglutathione lyase family enzyme